MVIPASLAPFRRIALDTNIFIYILNGDHRVKPILPLFTAASGYSVTLLTSVIAYTECAVLPYRQEYSSAITAVIELFQLPNLQVLPFDLRIADQAARLRANHPALRMPDAILLATALTSRAEAFLTNDAGLRSFKELPIILLDEC